MTEEPPMTKEELQAYWAAKKGNQEFIQDPLNEIAHLRYEAGVRDMKIAALESQVAALNVAIVKLFNRGAA